MDIDESLFSIAFDASIEVLNEYRAREGWDSAGCQHIATNENGHIHEVDYVAVEFFDVHLGEKVHNWVNR